MANAGFLVAFLVLPVIAYVWVRSAAWLAIALAVAFGFGGGVIGWTLEHGFRWTFVGLQWALVALLALVAGAAFLARARHRTPFRRDLAVVFGPMLVFILIVVIVRWFVPPEDGILAGVGYFFNHPVGEDNAKWLDFSSQMAAGVPITQVIPMGGPLQLVVVMVGTAIAVLSSILFGGVNEVAVAVNAVIYAEFFLVASVPMALAPLAVTRVGRGKGNRQLIPASIVWVSAFLLGAASLVVTRYGHLTFQFIITTVGLWVVVFLVGYRMPRVHLLMSLVVVTSVIVWFPLNMVGLAIVAGYAFVYVRRWVRAGFSLRSVDWISAALLVAVTFVMWFPLTSSLQYAIGTTTASAESVVTSLGGGAGVRTVGAIMHPVAMTLPSFPLFSSTGGTEETGPILVLLLGVSLVAVTYLFGALSTAGQRDRRILIRFVPGALLIGYSVLITIGDLWVTGEGPHYGASKMIFLTVVVLLAASLPLAFMQLDAGGRGMTNPRIVALVAVILALTVDTLLPRSAAQLRPQQWSSIAGDRPGYWWPAEVRPVADQSIADNPIGCVMLAPGDKVPSALPNGQITYTCSRILSGLSGADSTAQPLVDWLRREWLTNTPAWADVYNYLADMPPEVRAKQLILLDFSNNVKGLETIDSLLARYPASAGLEP